MYCPAVQRIAGNVVYADPFNDYVMEVARRYGLGPLLFILYINDFQRSSSVLSFIFFADGSSVFFSHKCPQIMLNTVNEEFRKVMKWINANKLSLNLQKTNYILFSNPVNILPGEVAFNNNPIEKVTSTKFLGIYIDEKLNWKTHVDNIK